MNTSVISTVIVISAAILIWAMIGYAYPKAGYEESKVPKYTLPDPLVTLDGKKVEDEKTWREVRRPEIFKIFQEEVYGKCPGKPKGLSFSPDGADEDFFDGKAAMRQVTVKFTDKKDGPKMSILIFLPRKVKWPCPIFLTLNFYGNHSIHPDPRITLSNGWFRNNKKYGVVGNRATEKSRGARSSRWPVEKIIDGGYGLATIYYGDIDPDFHDEFRNGVHPHFYDEGQSRPDRNEWGSISAWAWGLSRAMDYIESDADIDQKRVIVMGHSRLGKTSIWAGARDERFAIVISNNSGCGGAALSKRCFGETVARINKSFPHWFCENFKKYNEKEEDMKFDQHMLISLIAPRPVYIASAVEDRWADPKGEFLSGRHASPVYEMLGKEGLPADKMPGIDKPVMGTIGYHIRTGKHDVKEFDWEQYMKFADKHFGKK